MPKKTLYIILAVIAGLVIIGGLIWYFVLKPGKVTAPASGVGFTVPGQTKSGNKLKVISESPVISLRQNGESILFYDFSGQLWLFNPGEAKPVLSGQAPVENLSDIIWPKTFSPDGKKIVYQRDNGLFTSDSNGKNQKTLIGNLKLKDMILKWPSANKIALFSKPSGLIAGSLWFLDTRNLNFSKIINSFLGLEILFSPDGSSFIYSHVDSNGKNPTLAIYDKKGNQKIISNISTLVDKCVWAKDLTNIYCAAPKLWPDSAVLPDDYYKNAFLTTDDIWKINTETGEKTLIFEYVGDVSNLAVSEDENNIFFISKENQFLYKLNIR